jgi:hypothetical protein
LPADEYGFTAIKPAQQQLAIRMEARFALQMIDAAIEWLPERQENNGEKL